MGDSQTYSLHQSYHVLDILGWSLTIAVSVVGALHLCNIARSESARTGSSLGAGVWSRSRAQAEQDTDEMSLALGVAEQE